MSEIIVNDHVLMDRLRIQATLRAIAKNRGESQMFRLLQQAIEQEFPQQHRKETRKTKS